MSCKYNDSNTSNSLLFVLIPFRLILCQISLCTQLSKVLKKSMYKTRPFCLLAYLTMIACKLKMLSTVEYPRRNPASLIMLFLVAQFVSLELSIFKYIFFQTCTNRCRTRVVWVNDALFRLISVHSLFVSLLFFKQEHPSFSFGIIIIWRYKDFLNFFFNQVIS